MIAPPPIFYQFPLYIDDTCFFIMFIIISTLRRIISRTTRNCPLCLLISDTDPFEPHHCHKILYWAAPPISFYFNQCILLRAFRRIIFPPGELKNNRSDQILLLLLSRHLLVIFALRHSVLKHDYAFCNAEKPTTLNCIAFSPGRNAQTSHHHVRRH